MSLATAVDVLMLGQLGQREVAAVGLSASAFFVAGSALSGASSAIGVLAAQHHGAGSSSGVDRATIQGWAVSLAIGVVLTSAFALWPGAVVGLVSDDVTVLVPASHYAAIASLTFIGLAFQLPITSALAAVGRPEINLAIGAAGVATNIALNWFLIFECGLGLEGAAWATVSARTLEAALAWMVFERRRGGLRRQLLEHLDLPGLVGFCRFAGPLTLNGVAWSSGMFIYDIIYGHMGARELAVMAVTKPIMNLCFALFWGIATATGIIIGHDLGARRYEVAWTRGWALTGANALGATVLGLGVWLSREPLLAAFGALPPATIALALECLPVALATLWLRAINVTIICGVLQSGGEHRFILIMDLGCQWLCGIPLCYAAAWIVGLPLPWVFAAATSEELVKLFICGHRMLSGRWQRTLV